MCSCTLFQCHYICYTNKMLYFSSYSQTESILLVKGQVTLPAHRSLLKKIPRDYFNNVFCFHTKLIFIEITFNGAVLKVIENIVKIKLLKLTVCYCNIFRFFISCSY